VLTALQDYPALQKIQFRSSSPFGYIPSLSGLEVLLGSEDSKVKDLVLDQVDTNMIGLHKVMQELECNTTVTNLVICGGFLSRENIQLLKSMLRQNTALESLNLSSSNLGSAGLAEIAPVLYSNTSIKVLVITNNGLYDIESAYVLRDLIRRNKTITSLCIAKSTLGRNAAAAGSISEGLRSNTTLGSSLIFAFANWGDQGVSVLANALAIRNASILELYLSGNKITSVGVHALVVNSVEAVKTLTKLSLGNNSIGMKGRQF
jgi:hypothetical protein